MCGAPLTITDSEWGAPLSAPGAYLKLYLQFGADAPLAENHYGAQYNLLGAEFLKLKLCPIYLISASQMHLQFTCI